MPAFARRSGLARERFLREGEGGRWLPKEGEEMIRSNEGGWPFEGRGGW